MLDLSCISSNAVQGTLGMLPRVPSLVCCWEEKKKSNCRRIGFGLMIVKCDKPVSRSCAVAKSETF